MRSEEISTEMQEYIEERAAIREYDGGYSRAEAEELARKDADELYR